MEFKFKHILFYFFTGIITMFCGAWYEDIAVQVIGFILTFISMLFIIGYENNTKSSESE